MSDAESKKKLFLESYDAYADAIYRHCFFRVYSRELAEDLVQDTFMKTWEYLSGGGTIENIRAFLYRVATNAVIDRSRKRKEASLDGLLEDLKIREPSIDLRGDMEQTLMIREVMSGLRFLPEDDRALIVMRYVDDLRPKEIAEILEVNANAVSVRLNRAVEKLKEKIRVA
ncbi:MAG: hypothetical protein A2934_00935 [Candidatus Sungbacteria bacterium RIFCSPLOWO2_01_FULL_47_10]|uniref:RNA polymerase sigma factor n=1 Tax=Candidatus Sungbacteria bacterium RIFCSPLOWO2_01_FULL_47_10 TaxID=1802276 RepID=A0A1G2L4W8_9BACT|nr:MAG: hypothetical protein A2934_00935 [Candidatus Sungbacteria bacterium RIFCSPLOWO2_01_FULL_47_10]